MYIISDAEIAATEDSLYELVKRDGLPAIAGGRYVRGALLGFGTTQADSCSLSALMAAKILSGVAPQDLPIERPPHPRVRLYAETAKDARVTVPEFVWTLADEILAP